MDPHSYRSLKSDDGELELIAGSPPSRKDHNQEDEPETSPSLPPPPSPESETTTITPLALLLALLDWTKHPANLAMLVWSSCAAASTAMLILLFLGALNAAFPSPELRNDWVEINYQLLNALFTLLSLYEHPKLLHHTLLLCRWRAGDAGELRRLYASSAAPRAGDRAHIAVVIALIHITLISQYILCGLYWGYSSARRPEVVENLFGFVGTVAPIAAGVYANYGPLRNLPEEEAELEPPPEEKRRRKAVSSPEWEGGMFDCCCCAGEEAATVSALACCCTFCLFGYNAERMGFGNMYVHAATFALLCFAPLLVAGESALNIDDRVVGDTVGAAGVALCALGLLYGGFYRIQMRKRFNLPGGSDAGDYAAWMFCWPCALAQEVRTANRYDVEDGRFYDKKPPRRGGGGGGEEEGSLLLQPLPREKTMAPAVALTAAPAATRMGRG